MLFSIQDFQPFSNFPLSFARIDVYRIEKNIQNIISEAKFHADSNVVRKMTENNYHAKYEN